MLNQKDLIKKVKNYNKFLNLETLSKAYDFALNAHKNQRRDSGDPYLTHPVAVADILTDLKLDSATIATGLLHDTIEDTKVTYKAVENEFGKEVTIVNFFATWCKPCLDEHNYINRFSNEKKIRVIGINYKDNPKKAIQWLKDMGNPYSNVPIDKYGRIAINWGVYGIPETFIVSSKGIIKYRHVGPVTKKIYKKINLLIEEIE